MTANGSTRLDFIPSAPSLIDSLILFFKGPKLNHKRYMDGRQLH